MKYTVTPAKDEMMKKATMITAAILGVDLLCIEAVEAVETESEADEMELGLGASFRCPIFFTVL